MAKAEVWLWLYTTLGHEVYDIKKRKDQFRSFMASDESLKDPLKRQTLKWPKLARLGKVLYKWCSSAFRRKTCD